jgi:hypothetical protein
MADKKVETSLMMSDSNQRSLVACQDQVKTALAAVLVPRIEAIERRTGPSEK